MSINFKEKSNVFSFLDEPRNLCQSELFNKNIFDKEEQEKYKILFFTKTSKSINLPELLFTNFIKSKEKKEYKILKYLYNNIQNIENNIDNFFEIPEEMKKSNENKINRLKAILYKNSGKQIKDITKILKSNYKKNRRFPLRIYLKKKQNNLYIYLIDLYHLAWTSTFLNRDSAEPEYNNHKRDTICISSISE